MIFHETKLSGVFEIGLDVCRDERGFFARSWCQREFQDHGLDPRLVQCNVSLSTHMGTLRGMHYQEVPHGEAKVVRCTKGSIYDVVIDLRRDSLTFRQWIAAELCAENRLALYVPDGFAHGFLTLQDDTEVFYQMSQFYKSDAARGVRWNDPAFQINWPAEPQVISERDRTYPDFE